MQSVLMCSLLALSVVPNVNVRDDFANSRLRFTENKEGRVAFIGGSITEMNGYRPMVCDFLSKTYPETKFDFVNGGISSTCSTTGAFRLKTDIFARGKVDLFFIEFAVNDDQDAGHTLENCQRGLEGIIRQALEHNPEIDIVVTFFVNPGMLKTIQDGGVPLTIKAHEAVLKNYDITSVNLAAEVARLIDRKELTWKQFGGTHPAPHGNGICAGMIRDALTDAWKKPLTTSATPHPVPPLLHNSSYVNGRFLNAENVKLGEGWQRSVPDWSKLPGGKRQRFTNVPMFHTEKVGAELRVPFSGRGVGAFVVAGPDAGKLEYQVDGGDWKMIDLYHRFSRGLHYPRTLMFENQLEPGEHVLTIRVAKESSSKGTATRVLHFVAN